MKVCVFGAGATGSYMAARLAGVPGITLSAVARGAHLRALQTGPIRVVAPGQEYSANVPVATGRPDDLPTQDIVFVTLKATSLPEVAGALKRLLGKEGHAVFATNGIPWWWNYGRPDARPLPLLDQEGALWNELTPQKALGCVIHSGNELIAPGVVRHNGNNHWPLGEPDNSDSERLRSTATLMNAAGINAHPTTNLRREIFGKLLRNGSLNSICALTGLPVQWLTQEPSVQALNWAVMDEILAIAKAHGHDVTDEWSRFRNLPLPSPGMGPEAGQKPSMLQDALARRPMEIDAIVGQTCALAEEVGVPCPVLASMLPLLRGLELRGKLGL